MLVLFICLGLNVCKDIVYSCMVRVILEYLKFSLHRRANLWMMVWCYSARDVLKLHILRIPSRGNKILVNKN
jgi:hypothetical protein